MAPKAFYLELCLSVALWEVLDAVWAQHALKN